MPLQNPEVWMRGPIEEIPPLLQPVAHALLQAREEVEIITKGFPDDKLWNKPSNLGSVGFHLQHIRGVLDRLFTYAVKKQLSPEQLNYLNMEGVAADMSVINLVTAFNNQIDRALTQLKETDETTLLEPRGIGRQQIPSNVIGLLFHAAEHIQRHVGQLLVTVRFVT
jgi:uncharacterized damage-inducible protein DinB